MSKLPRVKFYLPVEPFSINNQFYRDKRYVTADYRDWQIRTFSAMWVGAVQSQLKIIREEFDPALHAFVVRFDYCLPNFFTQKGAISAQSKDLSNSEKLLLDLLFLPKFHVLPVPYGAPNINVDDKYVISLSSRKRPSTKQEIRVSIAIVPKPSPL